MDAIERDAIGGYVEVSEDLVVRETLADVLAAVISQAIPRQVQFRQLYVLLQRPRTTSIASQCNTVSV